MLPIVASTENSGEEPKRIHGFTKSRILQRTKLKSNLDIYTYLNLGKILAICDNAMSSIFTYLQHKVPTIESTLEKKRPMIENKLFVYISYASHYKPRFVYFQTPF